MKYCILVLSFLFLGVAGAAESVQLYAQGCLPYAENNILYFNCNAEEKVDVELSESSNASHLVGDWQRLVELGNDRFVVAVHVEKNIFPDGFTFYSITGFLKNDKGIAIASIAKEFLDTDSLSLTSETPYGERKAFPHFFFGSQKVMGSKIKERIMKSSLRLNH